MKAIISPKQMMLFFNICFLAGITLLPNETYGMVDNRLNNEQFVICLERVYVDGVVSQEIIENVEGSKEEIRTQYEQWELVKDSSNELVFRTHIDDISPLLKTNGYFGISINNILSLYEGKPHASPKIIQSFFQVDVKKLESYHRKRLEKGIRIHTKDQYVAIMNFFKHYSLSPQ